MKFYHIGDIHIARSFNSASYSHEVCLKRRQDIKETFFKTLDMCGENGVNLLLIAGDLFEDEFVSMSDLKDIHRKFQLMENVHIVICAGNHDAIINEKSGYNLVNWSENVHVFGPELSKFYIEELNVDIYSFSWQTKELNEVDLSSISIEDFARTNILMLHGDAYNESQYLPLDAEMLEMMGFDYIALGHIHKPDVVHEKWAYCGSLEPLDYSETGEHGLIEGMVVDNILTYSFIPVAKREHIIKEIIINEEMSFEQIKDRALYEIEKEMKNNCIFKLFIKGIKDFNVIINTKQIKEVIEDTNFYCEVVDETISNYDLERVKSEHEGNIIEAFVNYMEEKGLDNPIVRDALNEGLNILLREKVD